MPTSNSTNFKMNGAAIMDEALSLAGIMGVGQSVDADIINATRDNLNIMMRHWENTGVRLWGIDRAILFPSYGQELFQVPVVTAGVPSAYACLESDWRQNTLSVAASVGASSVTLTNAVTYLPGDYMGIASDSNGLMWFTVNAVVGQIVSLYEVGTTNAASLPYAASADAIVAGFTTLAWMPLRIIEARRKDISQTEAYSVEVPLKIVGKLDYERIPNKGIQSIPIQLYQQQRITWTDVYIWPTTAYSNWAVCYSFERRYDDVDNGVNDVDFPPEAYQALTYGLAARMGRRLRIDLNRQQYLDQWAETYFQVMRNATAGKASIRFGVAR